MEAFSTFVFKRQQFVLSKYEHKSSFKSLNFRMYALLGKRAKMLATFLPLFSTMHVRSGKATGIQPFLSFFGFQRGNKRSSRCHQATFLQKPRFQRCPHLPFWGHTHIALRHRKSGIRRCACVYWLFEPVFHPNPGISWASGIKCWQMTERSTSERSSMVLCPTDPRTFAAGFAPLLIRRRVCMRDYWFPSYLIMCEQTAAAGSSHVFFPFSA